MAEDNDSASLLDKLAPPTEALKQFDAFPKLPSTYKHRSGSRGFLTILIGLLCFTLVLNDIGEYIWGWPEYHFGMDREVNSYMAINLDMIVNMPCRCKSLTHGFTSILILLLVLSVDLRDSTGDRLHLSSGFRRDGSDFDVTQAKTLQAYSDSVTTNQASVIPQTRRTRGFLATLLRGSRTDFKPTYKHTLKDDACRIYGTMVTKKVTANLHITTLGHGYASSVHVDHKCSLLPFVLFVY